MKKILFSLTCLASAMFSISVLAAGQIQGNLSVQLTVDEGCEIIGGTSSGVGNDFGILNFGTHSSLSNTIRAQSSTSGGAALQINCSNGLAYSVALDNGGNTSGAQRRLSNGSGDYINYNLYQDASYSTQWTGGTPRAETGTGSATNLIVYGSIPGGQTAAAGNYTDTVVITVAW